MTCATPMDCPEYMHCAIGVMACTELTVHADPVANACLMANADIMARLHDKAHRARTKRPSELGELGLRQPHGLPHRSSGENNNTLAYVTGSHMLLQATLRRRYRSAFLGG